MRRTLILPILIALTLQGCRKERTPSWDADYIVPLAKGELGLAQILPASNINTLSDNSLELNINEEFYSFSLDEIVKLPDTSIVNFFNIPFPLNLGPGMQLIDQATDTDFDFGDASLSMVAIKSGSMIVQLRSGIEEPTRVRYRIPRATLNGQSFDVTVHIPAATATSQAIVNKEYDLSGYMFDLTGLSGNKLNTVYTKVEAWIDDSANQVTVAANDSIVIQNTFSELRPDYARGYFGSVNYDVPLAFSELAALKNISGGAIDLNNVSAELKIVNGIGADAKALISELFVMRSASGQAIALTHPVIGNTVNINRAVESPAIDTEWKTSLNDNNSNITSMLEFLPDRIGYSIGLQINPLGNVSAGHDFIDSKRPFTASLNLKVPLQIGMQGLVLEDTLDFAFKKNEDTDKIKQGTIHIFAENGFPFGTVLQLYFLDKDQLVKDSAFATPAQVSVAQTDAAGKVTSRTSSHLVAEVSNDLLQQLPGITFLRLRATFNTANQPGTVKIYAEHKLLLKVTGEFKYQHVW